MEEEGEEDDDEEEEEEEGEAVTTAAEEGVICAAYVLTCAANSLLSFCVLRYITSKSSFSCSAVCFR